jgi:alpha-L-fucosidase
MFVHWGHSSQQGCELSWPLVGGVFSLPLCGDIPVAQYHSTALTFNPTSYNPHEWALMAKRLGMQYAILTTKHHDGFAIVPTQESDFQSNIQPTGRDYCPGIIDAMRSEGIRVGLYFSLIDWHHPDYPALQKLTSLMSLVSIVSNPRNNGNGFISFMKGSCESY